MAIKRYFFPKKWIIPIIAVTAVAAGGISYIVLNKPVPVTAYTVERQDVKETVLATGAVTSETNLSLSFKNAGVLTDLRVNVGSNVKKGQILAQLDERSVNVQLARARAAQLSAKANLEKVINGSSNEEIQVSQAAVAIANVNLQNAKSKYVSVVAQQKVLEANAYSALLNSGLMVIPDDNNSTSTVTVSGTYTGTLQGQYKITLDEDINEDTFRISGLETDRGAIVYDTPISFGTKGLFLTFSSAGNLDFNDTWTISIPNTQAQSYVSNYNAYQATLQAQVEAIRSAQSDINSAEVALQKAEADLALKKASARTEDITGAEAELSRAQADLLEAQNNYNDNIIYAPIDGVVTAVGIKIGEQVSPQKEVIMILNKNFLHVESNISESSIVYLKPGQDIDMTLDAFGPDKHFVGKIISIDPAATVVSGVINYKINSTIPDDPNTRPGMSVNLTIVIGEKDNVLAIPNRLIKYIGGQKIVLVRKNNQVIETAIGTGLVGDNLTEVVSGLAEGDAIAETPTK